MNTPGTKLEGVDGPLQLFSIGTDMAVLYCVTRRSTLFHGLVSEMVI